MTANCKTCGATLPGKHRPSLLDRDGIGDPAHKVNKATIQTLYDGDISKEMADAIEALVRRVAWSVAGLIEKGYVPKIDFEWDGKKDAVVHVTIDKEKSIERMQK